MFEVIASAGYFLLKLARRALTAMRGGTTIVINVDRGGTVNINGPVGTMGDNGLFELKGQISREHGQQSIKSRQNDT